MLHHTIKPLHRLNRAEVRELARAAQERGEADANPFAPDTDQFDWFQNAYDELQTA